MQNPSEARARRSQRDYSLPFKLAVVGQVGRGELSYKLLLRTKLSGYLETAFFKAAKASSQRPGQLAA